MSASTLRMLHGGCYAITLCLAPDIAALRRASAAHEASPTRTTS